LGRFLLIVKICLIRFPRVFFNVENVFVGIWITTAKLVGRPEDGAFLVTNQKRACTNYERAGHSLILCASGGLTMAISIVGWGGVLDLTCFLDMTS
jgi:hypothetical protein